MLSKISFPATHFQFPSKSATKRSFDKETKKKRKKKKPPPNNKSILCNRTIEYRVWSIGELFTSLGRR